MALFRMPRFIRRYLRRKMHPMSEKKAYTWREKLSVMYAIIAWQACGFVLYQVFIKGNKHWPTTAGLTNPEDDKIRPALWYAERLGIENANIVRISGFSVRKHELRNGEVVDARPDEVRVAEEELGESS